MTLNTEARDLRPPEQDHELETIECVRCGYDLVGIAGDMPCPECGLLAERSRKQDGHLSDATPNWLRGISIGIWLILAAHVFGIGSPLLLIAFARRFNYGAWPTVFGVRLNPDVLAVGGVYLATLLLLVGMRLLTRPQNRAGRNRALRWSLRAFAAIPLVTLASVHWLATNQTLFRLDVLIWPAFLVVTVGCVPIPALMFLLLRRLALRVLHRSLAEHAAIVGVGLSATLAAVPLIALTLRSAGTVASPFTRSEIAFGLLLAGTVAFALFAGWSVLNCVRFAFAFERAYLGAAKKWRDADRAAEAF